MTTSSTPLGFMGARSRAVITGGTQSDAGGFRYHTFTSPGTLTVVAPGPVQWVLVGSGGSPGSGPFISPGSSWGGGGGGGVVQFGGAIAVGTYPVTVTAPDGSSSFQSSTALRGGNGGAIGNNPGTPGGSGGGGGGGPSGVPGGTGSQGNPGGSGGLFGGGGGGGGAGGAGTPGESITPPGSAFGGNGGAALTISGFGTFSSGGAGRGGGFPAGPSGSPGGPSDYGGIGQPGVFILRYAL